MKRLVMTLAVLLPGCGQSGEQLPSNASVADPAGPPAVAVLNQSGPPGPKPRPSQQPGQPRPPEPSPCMVQDGRKIAGNALRATGTEPFWAADIVGRCITYSTPEDQAGTRVWTRFSGTTERGSWSGSVAGNRFEMRTRPDPACSDGMSDTKYRIAVSLSVSGEQRRGCAQAR